MSDLISLTVKQPFLTERGKTEYQKWELSAESGRSIYELLVRNAGFSLHEKNQGFEGCVRGICGRCKIRYEKAAPFPTNEDRRHFTPDELRNGFRLACCHKAVHDAKIELHFEKTRLFEITKDAKNQTEFGLDLEKTEGCFALGLLVDIGTTTVVMKLTDMNLGTILGEYAVLNPQRVLGTDVMTRLSMASSHSDYMQEVMCDCILQGLQVILEQVKEKNGMELDESQIPIYVAGNTTMLHLLFGLSTGKLGIYPFVPETLEEITISMSGHRWNALPGFSAFVGADLCADLCAISTDTSFLLLDLGTNAEMILFNGSQYFMTATAAGTAFCGGSGGKLLGTELIHETAKLYESGYLDDTGLLNELYFEDGYMGENGLVTQEDIRELQKAKAAVAAGIEILLSEADLKADDVKKVYICGGFGLHLNPTDAICIEMLPKEFEGKIESMGNLVLPGIYSYYSIPSKREFIKAVKETKIGINLAEKADFDKIYVQNMNIKNRPK